MVLHCCIKRELEQMLDLINEELSLMGRNIRGRLGYRAKGTQDYFLIPNILPAATFAEIQSTLGVQKSTSVRQDSFFRKGSAFDATDLRNS